MTSVRASRIRIAAVATAATVLWAFVFLLVSEALAALVLLACLAAIGVQGSRHAQP
jgi:hypothetical protein